ncbi:alpha/beta hydrolase [Streptomyces lasiicapitis]|uniref:alpha/beta hydrolase n=1 Tax=Streptomyces lasiicapitis TaxID=1923961 RepID=UPI0036551D4A
MRSDPGSGPEGPSGGARAPEVAPEARPLLDALAAFFPDLGGAVTDAAEARRVLAAAPASPFASPQVGSVVDRVIPGPVGAPEVPVRVYLPEATGGPEAVDEPEVEVSPRPRPTVVFFHGGGWSLCDLDTYDATARGLCRGARAAVVSVDYRLAPEHPFPAAVEDAYAAVVWAAGHRGELGGAEGPLVVAGDSAGGNLATVSALTARDHDGPGIALQVLIYPSVDARERTRTAGDEGPGAGVSEAPGTESRDSFLTPAHCRWFREQYLGAYLRAGGDPADPRVSPLLADLTGLPPAHVVTAGFDPLRDEGRAYAARLRDAGVAVTEGHFPAMFHGFLGFPPLLADARTAQETVIDAIASTVNGRKNGGLEGGRAG